jgi:hypothetical protein
LSINLEELRPDIIALCEHKMLEVEINRLHFDGYKICSYFSRKTAIGGGVMVMARKNVTFSKVVIPKIESLLVEKEFECCLVNFKADDFSFVLGCVYRTPKYCYLNGFLEKLENLLEILFVKFKYVVLVGDININVLEHNSVYNKFCNILSMYNMRYMVNFPTRITETCKSAIDNCLTNIDVNKICTSGIRTEISDHDGQITEILDVNINAWKKEKIKKYCRKFSKENIDLFSKYLLSESWFNVYQSPVDKKYDSFSNLFLYYFNMCFPKVLITKYKKMSNPWITDEVKDKKRELMELSKSFRETKNVKLRSEIKDKRKCLKKTINKLKREFFDSKVSQSSNVVKTTWQMINSEVGKDRYSECSFELFQMVSMLLTNKKW